MDHFTQSLAVGAVVGVLDVIPMLFQGVSARSCLSAFFVYLFAAVIVFHSRLPYLPWWTQGMAVALMLMIPWRSPSRAGSAGRSPSWCSTRSSSDF